VRHSQARFWMAQFVRELLARTSHGNGVLTVLLAAPT
jgi:hypothetical protein